MYPLIQNPPFNSYYGMQRISYLDGLRGIAAFIVVISHFVYAFYPALETGAISEIHTKNQIELWIATSPLNIFYSGNLAVCIFFVLSGFVLTHGFFKTRNFELLISIAFRRYFRLQIPILFTILLTYGMMKCSLFCNQKIVQITQSTWWLGKCWNFEPNLIEVLKQSFFYVLFDPTNSRNLYVGVMWTMPYEFVGSFLVFTGAMVFARKKGRFFFYAVLVYIFINSYFLAFILGMVLADAYSYMSTSLLKIESYWFKIGSLLLGLFCGTYPAVVAPGTIYDWMRIPWISHNESFFHIIGSFLILFSILNSVMSQKLLSMRFPQFLGRISFSMYLLHTLVIGSTASYFFHLMLPKFTYFSAFLFTIIVNFLIVFVLSEIMYRYVDVGAMRFSKYVYEVFQNRFLKSSKLKGPLSISPGQKGLFSQAKQARYKISSLSKL